MDEQQIRSLVREAIARHLGPSAPAPVAAPVYLPAPAPAAATLISHGQFAMVRPAGEVDCLIEPAVVCNHCGHCQCYGH